MKNAFWLVIVSMIIGQTIRLPGGGVLSDIIIPLYLAVFFVIQWKDIIKLPRYVWWWAIWLLWLLVGLLINLDNLPLGGGLQSGLYWIRLVVYTGLMIPWAVWIQQDREETWQRAWMMIVSAGMVVAGLGFFQIILVPDFSFMAQYGWDPHQGRLLSTWYDPNFVGGFLGLVLMLVVSRLLLSLKEKYVQWSLVAFLLGATSWIGLAIILTYSRSALLSTVIGLLSLTILISRKVLIVTILILFLILSLSPRLQDRIQGALELDVTASLRISSWQETLDDITDNPWIGIGYNTTAYQQVIPNSLNSSSGRDSSLLTLWLTAGIIGLIGYIALVGYKLVDWVWRFRTSPLVWERVITSGALAGWLVILSHSWFVNSLFYPHMMIPLFILLIL